MSVDQSQQVAQVYSWLRAMSGGKLSQSQVVAGDQIIEKNGLNVFAKLIGFEIPTPLVNGQRDISENGYAIIRDADRLTLVGEVGWTHVGIVTGKQIGRAHV